MGAIAAPSYDVVGGLDKAAASPLKIAQWFAGLAPQHPAYQRLQSALFRYREVAKAGGWPRRRWPAR